MMNQQEPTPYKVEPQSPKTKYSVKSNGDVKITQVVTTVSFWKSREFLSLVRQNEVALDKTRYNYSAEFIEKMKDQEVELIAEINLMKPVMEEAEGLAKKEYIRKRHDGLKANLIIAIGDKEINENWWQNVWLRAKPEIRKPILEELTEEQTSKVLKVIQKLKRKNIR